MDYCLIQTLVEAAYYKFKSEFPNEEPFFRITCTRKFGRSERRTWRQGDKGMRVVERTGDVSHHRVPLSGVSLDESEELKRDEKIKQRSEENRWISPMKTIPVKRTKIKDADKKKILTTKFQYDAMIDVRFDEPITVSSIRYFIDTTNGLLKEIQEGYKVFMEDPAIWKGTETIMMGVDHGVSFDEKLDRAIRALKRQDELKTSIEQKLNLIEEVTQTDAFSCFDCDEVVDNLRKTFKTTLTVRDLADKYISTQKKLNDLKSSLIPIFKHYKYMKLFDMMEKDGFIKTVGFLVDFLHTLSDDQNDYDDND